MFKKRKIEFQGGSFFTVLGYLPIGGLGSRKTWPMDVYVRAGAWELSLLFRSNFFNLPVIFRFIYKLYNRLSEQRECFAEYQSRKRQFTSHCPKTISDSIFRTLHESAQSRGCQIFNHNNLR